MKLTFDALLKVLVRHSTSSPPDALAVRLYHEGDAAHLKRWLDDGGAEEIWQKIYPREKYSFSVKFGFAFIKAVLRTREMAEQGDTRNITNAELWRKMKRLIPKERKRALEMRKKGKMTPEDFAAIIARLLEFEAGSPTTYLDPSLSVRSDKGGVRRRTIFCRLLSKMLHDVTGRWHDAEVARLCEIAFAGGGDITADMVRSAREAGRREATRKR
jgi:hypothetical protein